MRVLNYRRILRNIVILARAIEHPKVKKSQNLRSDLTLVLGSFEGELAAVLESIEADGEDDSGEEMATILPPQELTALLYISKGVSHLLPEALSDMREALVSLEKKGLVQEARSNFPATTVAGTWLVGQLE